MKLLVKLNNWYGGSKSEEITYWGTFDDAKIELQYIEWDGNYFEWVSYDAGQGNIDYVCQYSQVGGVYGNHRVYKIGGNYYTGPTCECGAKKIGAHRHSHWCPSYPYQK